MTSVSGVGANQKYVGVQLSVDKPQVQQYEKVPFPCHRCEQIVDSEKGYFVEHYRVKQDRYGGLKRVLCAASNNKVRVELRSVDLHGECEQCGTEMNMHLDEEFPGSLRKYGGVMEVPCVVCDGQKHATCEDCGRMLTEETTTHQTLGVTTSVWVHSDDKKNECGNGGEQWFVVDNTSTHPVTGDPVPLAGPFTVNQDALNELDNLANAPTVTGNEEFDTLRVELPGTNAKPFALSIKQNPACTVLIHDDFLIEERDDDGNTSTASTTTLDLNDPLTAALMGNTTAQEG